MAGTQDDPDRAGIDECAAEAAAIMSDLRALAGDLAGAALWRQVAADLTRDAGC